MKAEYDGLKIEYSEGIATLRLEIRSNAFADLEHKWIESDEQTLENKRKFEDKWFK